MRRRLILFALALSSLGLGAARAEPAPEPAMQRIVIEDDGVRIEELRVRGQTQRVVVRSKVGGARPYEILTGDAGRDPSQERRATGQRVWTVLSF